MIVGEFGAARAEAQADEREPDTILFYGEAFAIRHEVGSLAILEFTAAAESDREGGGSETATTAACYRLLKGCLAKDDWPRFRDSADENAAGMELLLTIAMKVYEVCSARPTESATGLQAGQSTPSASLSPSSTRKAALGLVPVSQVDLLTG